MEERPRFLLVAFLGLALLVVVVFLVASVIDIDKFKFNTGTIVVLGLAALGIGAAIIAWWKSPSVIRPPQKREPITDFKDAWERNWEFQKVRLWGIVWAIILIISVIVYVDYVEPLLAHNFRR